MLWNMWLYAIIQIVLEKILGVGVGEIWHQKNVTHGENTL